MVPLMSSIFSVIFSEWVTIVGNLPALLSPGPRSLGICLINVSDATKPSYFLAIKHEWIVKKDMVQHASRIMEYKKVENSL